MTTIQSKLRFQLALITQMHILEDSERVRLLIEASGDPTKEAAYMFVAGRAAGLEVAKVALEKVYGEPICTRCWDSFELPCECQGNPDAFVNCAQCNNARTFPCGCVEGKEDGQESSQTNDR